MHGGWRHKNTLKHASTIDACPARSCIWAALGELSRPPLMLQAPWSLFEADLTTPGSFDAAVKGADYVFHVASPVTFGVRPPQL